MKTSLSWLREYVELPASLTAADLDQALTDLGMEVESIVDQGATVKGDLVVGRVLEIEELTGFKKPIRFCLVDVGRSDPQEIVCGATNFAVGDLVSVILPGGELPGGFKIGARQTYGHNSNGMICSARELGLGEDHTGILVLPPGAAEPGADARPVVGLSEVLVEVEITPDRGYEMSVRGMARELSYAYESAYTDPATIDAPGGTADVPYPVRVDDTVGCDRFAARVVRGIDPDAQSPEWMQRRLIAAGIRVISLPVDITNYLMLELGQPMHVFDLNLLRGGLVVRRATPGEKLTTLDGVARVLDAEDMVICDDSGPISLAAVMGGETSEWRPETVDVLLEAAHWDAVMVGRTARRHKLFSEAAKRWERGVDPQLPLVALERAVSLLVAHAGGTVDERVLDIDNVVPPAPIVLDPTLPARRIGLAYSSDEVAALLARVGCTVRSTFEVTPPSWRPDLIDPADLVEEVARLGGYNDIPSVLPLAPGGGGLTRCSGAAARSAGRWPRPGTSRCSRTRSSAPEVHDAFGLPADDPRRSAVRLTNPLSEEEPQLRTSLLPPLLGSLKRNLGRGLRDLALYEMGEVFLPVLVDIGAAGARRRPPSDRRRMGGCEHHRAGPAVAPRRGADRGVRPGRLVGSGARGHVGRRGGGGADRAVGGGHAGEPGVGTGGRVRTLAPRPVRRDPGR